MVFDHRFGLFFSFFSGPEREWRALFVRVLLLISGASFVRGNYCLNKQFLLLKYGCSAEELSALLVFK